VNPHAKAQRGARAGRPPSQKVASNGTGASPRSPKSGESCPRCKMGRGQCRRPGEQGHLGGNPDLAGSESTE
jgi:hypothetical protein